MNDLAKSKRDAVARQRAWRAVLNNTSAELIPGNPYGFIGPTMPPSADRSKRDHRWEMRHTQATWYMWGLSDGGQRRDANDIFRFGDQYADAYWEYDCQYRGSMRSMLSAVEAFDRGERL